jgi:hypothetical protein
LISFAPHPMESSWPRDLIVAVLIQNLLVGDRNMLEIVSSIDFRWMLLDWVWSALSIRDCHRKID